MKEKLLVTMYVILIHGEPTTLSSSFWRKRGDGFLPQSDWIL